MTEFMTAICFAILVSALASASLQDIRSREVSDAHWRVIGAAGIAAMMIFAVSDAVTAERLMVCAGSAMLLFDITYDREWKMRPTILFYAVAALLFIIPFATSFGDPFVKDSLTIPVCFVLFLALFFGGVIKGGADVKCLITMAILFPAYPMMFGYPVIGVPPSLLSAALPFPLAVLFHASLFSVFAMVPIMIRNVMRGDTKFPNMFSGYRTDAAKSAESHVWPMRNECAADDGKIWVTPKIPFIVPITAAVIFVAFAGNVLFLL